MSNENYIILEGKDIKKLIEEGLEILGKKEQEVEIEVLEKGRKLAGLTIKKHKIKMKEKDCTKDNCLEPNLNIGRIENDKSSLDNASDDEDFIDSDIGSFKIKYLEDGVYLTVHSGDIVKINIEKVIERIQRKEIDEVDYSVVKLIVNNAEGKPIKIAPSQQEKRIDSKIEVEISNDKMEGYITLIPPYGGKDILLKEVLDTIKQSIKIDVDEQEVKQILDEKIYNKKALISKGSIPVDGKNGYIKYNFEDKKDGSPQILEDGSVDFRDLNLISNIKAGDILAEIISPTEGMDGINILGEVINHKVGKQETLKYGNNIMLSEDGTKLIAQVDGQVTLENGKVVVHDIYNVNSDVDNSTGNIDFNGSVKIKGNIVAGFKVTAKGNIEIDGVVEGALIKSDGNIIIKRGVQGYNVAEIHAKGNIACKYIENTKICCEGDIYSEAIMHSDVVSGGSVVVSGRKGLIVGGSCKASKKIDAKTIGSNMATVTLLEVGLDPKLRIDQEKLKETVNETEIDIDKFDKIIKHLTKSGKEIALSEDRKEMLNKGIMAKLQLQKKLEILNQELQDINDKVENAYRGEIKIEDTLHLGVKIIMGNRNMFIQEDMNRCKIYMDKQEGQIKTTSY